MNTARVLALALCEKLINRIICTDALSQEKFAPLSGKVLRVIINKPDIALDVLFGEGRVRFEPVARTIFEPQGGVASQADCTLSVDSPKHLLSLMQNPSGNLPIRGDHRVLLDAKTVLEGFEPDIWSQLENVLGYGATGHLHLLAQEISPIFTPIITTLKRSLAGSNHQHSQLDEAIQAKKQLLLQLQSDIERHQAKLAQLQQTDNILDTH
ncbi:ubiquinone biosynthesis protein UbiJ [Moraxella cuniculi DSM 21768]|uniref:Ubiquinone biosynthesis protein UbiJ n=2 Tax=Moraxella cuniculi TaxID=34061 RepID=A0A1N7F3B3_9GAMM|nr:hypothetical protein [Moraxella cuniculi]OOS05015.1 hypothetical protein B0189_07560 [Moraxella cuniculi]SIR94847.1 ubiquinone biosynthesis protein UbiJ [Moraxella cuniculi DSM 21768]VEG13834.1 Uncharacterized protein conserved in bacteria [Moraxella cuniculi]